MRVQAKAPQRFGWGTGLGLVVVALALGIGVVRFARGLGAVTNLSDAIPWGLWISVDVLTGVALAAGGFTIAAVVHLAGVKRYEPLARPAVLTAFLGYLMVILALMFDLGRPWNIWRPIFFWQPHSVMFEVGWCVMLYTLVLTLEFSPLPLERSGLRRALRFTRWALVPLAILGGVLSTLHQSSLGALFLVVPDKLHPLWYSPLLPAYFLMSAVAAGLGMVILESKLSGRFLHHEVEHRVLASLATPAAAVLSLYFVLRLGDLAGRGAFLELADSLPQVIAFSVEIAAGVVAPIVLFLIPAVKNSTRGLLVPAVLVVGGLLLNRINVGIIGLANLAGEVYIPAWTEFVVTAGIIALGVVAFSLVAKFLPLFPPHTQAQPGTVGA
ncbi:MAG: Ni/Fe-hydrogenase cytochrome b subunit [Dehalococcoidia bacterium]|nr:Ni/Fe-hydrogenase cytochrome b subunit [Dehalococcoidia bacterium]